ncbi:MAG: ATP-binding cassette domain-containing protein [Kiloniellales bacterium]|nr:ATP-binding cassette domain-containing protein [Kiloniellales bacterium]
MGALVPASTGGAQRQRHDRLEQILQSGELGEFRAISDIAACLMPLLSALGWHGNPRQLAEAMPHFADSLDIVDLLNVLANLNYVTRPAELSLDHLDPRLLPCLFVPDDGAAKVLLEEADGGFRAFDAATAETGFQAALPMAGTAYFVSARDSDGEAERRPQDDWFRSVAQRFRGLVLQMLGITFLNSVLALAVPLFIMTVYDRVIPSRSLSTLGFLFLGVLLALAIDAALRFLRARVLAYVGARIDVILGAAALQQILHLPIVMTERATIGAQVSRLRQFESVREFFTGPLAGVFLELPFLVIFVAVIGLIAGPLAWIPIILTAVFLCAALAILPSMRGAVAESGEARARRQSFAIEMISNMRAIKQCALERTWSGRYREIGAKAALANFRTSRISVFVQTLSQTLMFAAGIATATLGTLQVLDGAMTVGALIATMALVWRVLSPLQVGFLSLTRLEQVKLGLKQMNQLMRLKLEREPGRIGSGLRSFKGEVAFRRASLRYTADSEPALFGINFTVKPGEMVAVAGANGVGKSSVLKLIAGLYQPQAGAVMIDGIDLRQLDVGELRTSIGYVPQTCHLFHGTIAQNLRLANPTASDAELAQAALDAGLLEDILSLPEGFETRLTDRLQRQLPRGLKQKIILARAYVTQASIYLLDEPAYHLDAAGDTALMRKLQQLRGRATVFIVTQRPSHMRLADRLIVLDSGMVALAGHPEAVLAKMQEAAAA